MRPQPSLSPNPHYLSGLHKKKEKNCLFTTEMVQTQTVTRSSSRGVTIRVPDICFQLCLFYLVGEPKTLMRKGTNRWGTERVTEAQELET